QVNAWLPHGVRTGLIPVELRRSGARLCHPEHVRVIPAPVLIPRIISVTDGINLVQRNRSTTGLLKIQLEEVANPDSVRAEVDGIAIEHLEILCIDPVPPRHEVNLRLPAALVAGGHMLMIRIGLRQLLPVEFELDRLSL